MNSLVVLSWRDSPILKVISKKLTTVVERGKINSHNNGPQENLSIIPKSRVFSIEAAISDVH